MQVHRRHKTSYTCCLGFVALSAARHCERSPTGPKALYAHFFSHVEAHDLCLRLLAPSSPATRLIDTRLGPRHHFIPCALRAGAHMEFERVDVDWNPSHPASSWSDAWLPMAQLRSARATLTRHATLASEWRLCRLQAPGAPARVFVFPTPAIEQPPASLWISNLRSASLARSFCLDTDLWSEVVRSGWAGYDFNRIQDRGFSSSGGALDASFYSSWQQYGALAGLHESLLCALPWDGLAAMWGTRSHQRALALRESDILHRHTAPAPVSRRRDIKKA